MAKPILAEAAPRVRLICLAEALSVHLEDGRVVDQSVDGCDGHGLVREDPIR